MLQPDVYPTIPTTLACEHGVMAHPCHVLPQGSVGHVLYREDTRQMSAEWISSTKKQLSSDKQYPFVHLDPGLFTKDQENKSKLWMKC